MTDEEQRAALARIANDPVIVAMDALRQATRMFARWPWSTKRQAALMTALERVMELHVNRVEGLAGHMLAGPYERLAERIAALEHAHPAERARHE